MVLVVSVFAILIAVMMNVLSVTGIIGSLISLFHALQEEEKRMDFIIISAVGFIASSLVHVVSPYFMVVIGYACMTVSLNLDEEPRNKNRYWIVPIVVTIVLTALYALLVFIAGYQILA